MTRILTSLRYRFFLALGAVLLMALVALAIIAQQFVIPALLAKEDEYATAELDRAMRAIDNELTHLSLLNKDWATWDDSYAFMQGSQTGYLESNLDDALVFEDARLRMMAFLTVDGTPYRIAGIDPEDGSYASCPGLFDECGWATPFVQSLMDKVATGTTETRHTWLLAAPERALVSIWPIVRGDGSGPIMGWLSMVRTMDEEWFARFEEGTGLSLSVDAVESAVDVLPPQTIERADSQAMTATRAIPAAPQDHYLRLQVSLQRQSFKASLETFRFALYWTVGLLIVVVVVVLILLERMVLSPLRQFSVFTQQLQKHADAGPPLHLLNRRDEIGTLAREFQHLLEYQRRQTSSLVELSQRDPLTGLANRRLFDERLASALDLAGRTEQTVALLMVDIDSFKSYNDHYGHPAGDECLKTIAETMRRHFDQPQQLVARTGGEEFSIILPATTPEASRKQAEGLRLAVEALALPHAASTASTVVTVSIGGALFTPAQRRSAEALIDAADDALYAAKQAGRNRVSLDCADALA